MVARLTDMGAGSEADWRSVAGIVVVRVLFPLWLGAGALFKLASGGPSVLPVTLIKGLGGLGVDLMFVLSFAIGVELTVVGLAWLIGPLARLVAGLVLGLFIIILVIDISLGAASCGCFGSVELSPWFTLVVDGLLLLGTLLLGRRGDGSTGGYLRSSIPLWRVMAVLAWAFAAFAIGFGVPAHRLDQQRIGNPDSAGSAAVGSGAATPASVQVPPYYLPQYETWQGERWDDLDIATWVKGETAGLDNGVRYVLFYRKDCEHCHALMEVYLAGQLSIPTLAVAVPEKEGFPTVGIQPMSCAECARAELPDGCDWFLATPVLVRLRDGVVECVAEEDPAAPECIQW